MSKKTTSKKVNKNINSCCGKSCGCHGIVTDDFPITDKQMLDRIEIILGSSLYGINDSGLPRWPKELTPLILAEQAAKFIVEEKLNYE